MANNMKEIANLLGVELEEEFEIEHHNCTYVLRETGLYEKGLMSYPCVKTLNDLLTGILVIKRPPWKPQYEDIYWVTDGVGSYGRQWQSSIADWNAYKIGNCYQTQEEAQENKSKWLDFYASNEVLEV